MDDLECPRTSDGGPYAGYCAQYTFACEYDCRNGINPITGEPYQNHDCSPPAGSSTSFKCVANQCVEKTCVERGGAQYGAEDQLCCGEDRDHTGYTDAGFADLDHPANACPAGVDAGQFYLAPAPPWCQPGCSTDPLDLPDGGQISAFEQTFDTCSVDSGLPSFDSSPNMCVQYAMGVTACVIAAPYLSECPHGWSFGAPYVAGCMMDSDCAFQFDDGGFSDGGVCHMDLAADGGVLNTYCACDALQDERLDAGAGVLGPYLWGGECPNLSRCYQHKQCVFTVGCQPNFTACSAAP
jgi:hypothetical protein